MNPDPSESIGSVAQNDLRLDSLNCDLRVEIHFYSDRTPVWVVHENNAPDEMKQLAELLLIGAYLIDMIISFGTGERGSSYARLTADILETKGWQKGQKAEKLVSFPGRWGDQVIAFDLTSGNGTLSVHPHSKGFGWFFGPAQSDHWLSSIYFMLMYFASRRKDDSLFQKRLSFLADMIANSIKMGKFSRDNYTSVVKGWVAYAFGLGDFDDTKTSDSTTRVDSGRSSNPDHLSAPNDESFEAAKRTAVHNLSLLPEIWRFVAWTAGSTCWYKSLEGTFSKESLDRAIDEAQLSMFSTALEGRGMLEVSPASVMASSARAREEFDSELRAAVSAIQVVLMYGFDFFVRTPGSREEQLDRLFKWAMALLGIQPNENN